MKNPRSILEEVYQSALSKHDALSALSAIQRKWVETVAASAESHKAVVAVLATSLTKKIETPTQDIRYHKVELPDGYSGRSFDTEFVTPFIREKFSRLAMKESGWLTRSLEQVHAFTLDFPGKIRNSVVKNAFLHILEDVEDNQASPEKYLRALFALLIDYTESSKVTFAPTPKKGIVVIESIIEILKEHFFHTYGVAGASRLPVLAVYSVYELLMDYDRYTGKKLCPLKSHTTSDIKSSGIGDIEVLDEQGEFFEGVEVKHGIAISPMQIQDAFDKLADTAVCRYYLLTTAEPEVKDIDAVRELISNYELIIMNYEWKKVAHDAGFFHLSLRIHHSSLLTRDS